MCETQLASHPELWEATSVHIESRGPEADVELWREAEKILDDLCGQYERHEANDAAYMALVDAYNRCIEERRRAEDLLKLHEVWRSRPIGGVEEPEG